MIRIILLVLFLSFQASAQEAEDVAEVSKWSVPVLQEAGKLEKSDAPKAYAIYLQVAREYEMAGGKKEALKYYQQAAEVSGSGVDKSEAYVQLVSLNSSDKEVSQKHFADFEQWLKNHPDKEQTLKPWLATMRNHFAGTSAVKDAPPMYRKWAIDQQIPELMKEEKFKEAFNLINKPDVSQENLGNRLLHDVLSSVVEGKKNKKLFCEPTLQKYPTNTGWSMEVCRYLKNWQQNKKDPNFISKIESQLKVEDPSRLYYLNALRKL